MAKSIKIFSCPKSGRVFKPKKDALETFKKMKSCSVSTNATMFFTHEDTASTGGVYVVERLLTRNVPIEVNEMLPLVCVMQKRVPDSLSTITVLEGIYRVLDIKVGLEKDILD